MEWLARMFSPRIAEGIAQGGIRAAEIFKPLIECITAVLPAEVVLTISVCLAILTILAVKRAIAT